jgi:hypothetical protein
MLVFVEDANESIISVYAEAGYFVWFGERCGQRLEGPGVADALMRPMPVVEVLELAQGVEQMVLVPDQGPIQELSPAVQHPAFHDRVHARGSYPAEHDFDAGVGQDRVEQGRNFPSRSRIRYRARLRASSRSMTRLRAV